MAPQEFHLPSGNAYISEHQIPLPSHRRPGVEASVFRVRLATPETRDISAHAKYALKLLQLQANRNPEAFLDQCGNEARAPRLAREPVNPAGQIARQHIIEIADHGECQDPRGRGRTTYAIVMAWVEHSLESVREAAPGGKLPFDEATGLIAALADAVHVCHIHPLQITHGDISPSNIRLRKGVQGELGAYPVGDQFYVPVLADFEWARLRAEVSTVGRATEMLAGTRPYMAPEQFVPDGRRLTEKIDIYALGVILYELLTGKLPIKEPYNQNTLTELPSLLCRSDLDSGPDTERLVDWLNRICYHCLRKRSEDRLSADQLATDLRRVIERRPPAFAGAITPAAKLVDQEAFNPTAKQTREELEEKARQERELHEAQSRARRQRNRQFLRIVAAFGFVLIGGIAALALSNVDIRQARDNATTAQQEAETQRDETKKQTVRAEEFQAEAERLNLRASEALCEEGEAGRGILLMSQILGRCPQSATSLRQSNRIAITAAATKLHTLETVFECPRQTTIAAFSPDGKTILFGGEQETRLIHFDKPMAYDTGRIDSLSEEVDHTISSGAFSPDGMAFVTSTMSSRLKKGIIRFRETASGKEFGDRIVHTGTIKSVVFDPDGKKLLVGANGGDALKYYGMESRKPVPPSFNYAKEGIKNVYAAVFSPDGMLVATAAQENQARLWDAKTGEPVGPVIDHPGAVFTVSFSSNGTRLVTGCRDGGARVWEWEVESENQMSEWYGKPKKFKLVGQPLMHSQPVRTAVFSRDGRYILTCCEKGGGSRLWEIETGQPVGQVLSHNGEIRHAVFSPDRAQTYILTAGFEETARLWRRTDEQSNAKSMPHPAAVAALAFNFDGTKLLTGCEDSLKKRGEARLWDPTDAKPLGNPMHQDGQVMALAFSPDGRYALTGGNNGEARLWATATSSRVGDAWEYGKQPVAAVGFSLDGEYAAIGGRNSEVQLRRVPDGRIVSSHRLSEENGWWVWSLAFSPNREFLLAGGGRFSQILQLRDLHPVGTAMNHSAEVRTTILSPNGEVILTCSYDSTASLWSASDGRLLSTLRGHLGNVLTGAFRPDSMIVATASEDRTVRLWNVQNGQLFLEHPLLHDGGVLSVAFSPDGKSLVTGCEDGAARLWSVDDSYTPNAILKHRGRVNQVAFSPNGKMVATGSNDGTARLWTLPTPISGEPLHVKLWAEVLTGMRANDDGTVQVLRGGEWQERKHELASRWGGPLKSE